MPVLQADVKRVTVSPGRPQHPGITRGEALTARWSPPLSPPGAPRRGEEAR